MIGRDSRLYGMVIQHIYPSLAEFQSDRIGRVIPSILDCMNVVV
jgi:hypothetical protein